MRVRAGRDCTPVEVAPGTPFSLFAKVLGQLDTHGAAVVVPALTVALATGTPLLLALTPAPARDCLALDAVPALLRDVEVPSGVYGCFGDPRVWLEASPREQPLLATPTVDGRQVLPFPRGVVDAPCR